MSIERVIGGVDPGITRVKLTPAGLVVEADASGKLTGYPEDLYERVRRAAWDEAKEIVYSLITFTSSETRFAIEGTLREQRTQQSFNMSLSTLGANDLFCRFTKYDFDVLTLSNRDESTVGLFIIEDFSPPFNPTIVFRELDVQGFQFQISSKVKRTNGYYEISLGADQA